MEHKAYKVVYIKEILLNYYCNYLSLSSNLIYGIHCSYYSILISMCIENIFLVCWLHFWYYYSNVLPYIYCYYLKAFEYNKNTIELIFKRKTLIEIII